MNETNIGLIHIDFIRFRKLDGKHLIVKVCISSTSLEDSTFNHVESTHVAFDLKKPSSVSWNKFWDIKGFERRQYSQCWSTQKQRLDLLQKIHPLVSSQAEMAQHINDVLQRLEAKYEATIILGYVQEFSIDCITRLLMDHGHFGLQFNRKGQPRPFAKNSDFSSHRMISGFGHHCFIQSTQ